MVGEKIDDSLKLQVRIFIRLYSIVLLFYSYLILKEISLVLAMIFQEESE